MTSGPATARGRGASPGRGPRLAALAAAAALLALTGVDMRLHRDAEIANAQRDIGAVTRTFSRRLESELERLAEGLRLFDALLARIAPDGLDAAAGGAGALQALVDATVGAQPLLGEIKLLDAHDAVVMRARPAAAGLSLAALPPTGAGAPPPALTPGLDDEFRLRWRAGDPPGGGALIVSRLLHDARGGLTGTLEASIDLAALRDLLDDLDYSTFGVTALFTESGILLARSPDPEAVSGTSLADYPLFAEHLPRAASGFFLAPEQSDGRERFVSYRRLAGVPLVAAVAVPPRVVFADYYPAAMRQGALALAAALLVAWFGVRLGRTRGQAAVLEHALEHESERRSRESQVARGLLDAIPASIALLDADGRITAVNAVWRRFAAANGMRDEAAGVGRSYLLECDAARGDDSQPAPLVSTGLRDVLEHRAPAFELEYPCHGPAEERWFRMVAAPMPGTARDSAGGAVVMHFDVTQRHVAESRLVHREASLREITENLPGVVFEVERDAPAGRGLTYVSPRSTDLLGIAPEEFLADGELWSRFVEPGERERVMRAHAEQLRGDTPLDVRFRARARDGRVLTLRALSRGLADGHGARSTGLLLDVSEEHLALERLAYVSGHDPLTGLLNRDALRDHVAVSMRAAAASGHTVALLLVDVDGFDDVNDAHGVAAGDAALRTVGTRLGSQVREGDAVGRISGHAFAVLQARVEAPPDAASMAEKILAAVAQPIAVDGGSISLQASIGIVTARNHEVDAEKMFERADIAMREARRAGGNAFHFFERRLHLQAQTRAALRGALTSALDDDEFLLAYQPKLRLDDLAVTGCEALLRWQHPAFGLQAPDRFIPIAEQSGLIVPIGAWALREACRQGREWLDAGLALGSIAVNVSAVQFARSDMVALVREVLEQTGLPPSQLQLELTESIMANASPELRAVFHALRELGVSIAVDDFGIGYSSLAYLRNFALDVVKVDKVFVQGALTSSSDRSIVEAVTSVGHSLGLEVVAEGVETLEHLALLRELGCELGQGYLFSPPLSPQDFAWFAREGHQAVRRKIEAADPGQGEPQPVGRAPAVPANR